MSKDNQNIEVLCIASSCDKVPQGSKVTFNGPMLKAQESDDTCMTALQAIYPYILAARFQVPPEQLGFKEDRYKVQCPDNGAVTFEIKYV